MWGWRNIGKSEIGLRPCSGIAVRDSDGFGGGSDSDGFGRIPSSLAGNCFAVLYSLYGHFDPTETGSGFGRIR